MIGRDRVLSLIHRALELSSADQTEVTVRSNDTDLTRVANSVIHQNVSEADVRVAVRVACGGRLGQASTSRLDDGALREAVETAVAIARSSRPDPDFPGFVGPQTYPEVEAYDPGTAAMDPRQRALAIARIAAATEREGMLLAGFYSTGASEVGIGNSQGVEAYHLSSRAAVTWVVTSEHGSGYAAAVATSAGALDPERAAQTAIAKCRLNRDQVEIAPGRYTVILEPEAVATFLSGMAMAFGGDAVRDGRSPVAKFIGQRLVDEDISLWDDALDPRGLPVPFDAEGVPKRRVDLIERGVVRSVVHSTYTAAGVPGAATTGHAASGRGRGMSALPTHVFMQPGSTSLDDMIATTERGLLVTRFWYHRVVHPFRTLVTGLTRDGTFLVEDGRVVAATKNLRYTHPVLEALNSVAAIGDEPRWCGMHVPALKVGQFLFTGVTTH